MPQVPNITLNDDTTIPQLGFGVWQISEDDIVPAVSAALEAGIRHIDTASAYGNEVGVGKAIAESGIPRDQLYITTKLGRDDHLNADEAIEKSLERLGLDSVNLYLVHWPKTEGTHIKAWEGVLRAKERGLITSAGVSNYHAHHLDDIIGATNERPVVDQVEIHPTFTQTSLVTDIRSRGIEVESWTPLGRGDLEESVITDLAKRLDRTAGQVILRWHIQKGYIVFPKSVTPSRIAENAALFDFELSDDDIAAIDGLDRGERTGGDPETF